MNEPLLSPDDVFVLGNIASLAVLEGMGETALQILKCLQTERPQNAGSHIMQAIHLHAQKQTREAIRFLSESKALEAQVNCDEAIAIYIFLLSRDGQTDAARELAVSTLNEPDLLNESARSSIQSVLSELTNGQPADNFQNTVTRDI